MELFVCVATAVLCVLALVWKSEDRLNLFIKAFLGAMTIWGILVFLHLLGFIIKA